MTQVGPELHPQQQYLLLMLMMLVLTTEKCDISAARGPNPAGLVSTGPCSLSIGVEIKESTKMLL
jgi:hypothetical protein